MTNPTYAKPFLKWPGGKYRLAQRISNTLAQGKRLIEPFVGSGAVFLSTHYKKYLLADSNPDLINLYQILKQEGQTFIACCQQYFQPENNSADAYYAFREDFNQADDTRSRAALFVYLNRHCYNGLCRYNSKGQFNSPFGRYKKPYFPRKEMESFIAKAKQASFVHAHFTDTMAKARRGDIVYCDPPYIPISKTAYFTDYFAGGFDQADQVALAQSASKLANRGVQVVISNHNTEFTRKLYQQAGAHMQSFEVRRTISCNANNRAKVGELLAVFG